LAVSIEATTKSAVPGVRLLLRGRRDAELLVELADPLQHERRRHEDQRPADEPAHDVFLQNESGFDRLAEADLIGENGASAHFAQHLARRRDLVRHRLESRQAAERLQLVEARHQFRALGFDRKRKERPVIPRAVARRALRQFVDP